MSHYLELVEPRGAIPALDGVRGIAILSVVLFHVTEPFHANGSALVPVAGIDLSAPLRFGWAGVNLFFVLSGYLITRQLLRHHHELTSARGIGRYLARRWLRIVPLYYAVLLVAALQLTPGHTISARHLSFRVGYHLLFLQDYLPSNILGPFWSLGVEEKFYLLMPILLPGLLLLRRLNRQLSVLALLALVPLAIRIWMTGRVTGPLTPADFILHWRNPFHLNLDALMAGVIAAWLAQYRAMVPWLQAARTPARLRLAGIVTVALVLGTALAPVAPGWLHQTLLQPALALALGCWTLGVALEAPGAQPVLEGRWLGRAGRLAYAWYLSHILVLSWLLDTLIITSDSSTVTFVRLFLVFMLVSIVVAMLLHFAIEKPFLLLKARIGAPQATRLDRSSTCTSVAQ